MLYEDKNKTLIRSSDAVIQTLTGAKPHPPLNFAHLQQDKKRHPTDLDALFLLPYGGLAIVELKKGDEYFSKGQDILFGGMVNIARKCGNTAFYLKCVHSTQRGLPTDLNEVYILEEVNGFTRKKEYNHKEMPLKKWLNEHFAFLKPIKFPYMYQAASQGILIGSYGYEENSLQDKYIENTMHWIVDMFTKMNLPSGCFFIDGGKVIAGQVDLATSLAIRQYNGHVQVNNTRSTVYQIQKGFQEKYNTYPSWNIDDNGIMYPRSEVI